MTSRTREVRYTDPDEAAAAIRATDVQFDLLAPSTSDWRVGHADLEGPSLWWGRLGAKAAAWGATPPNKTLTLVAGVEARGWTLNRDPFTGQDVCFLPVDAGFAGSYPVPAFWYGLQCPRGWLERQSEILTQGEFDFGQKMRSIKTSSFRVRNAFMAAVRFAIGNSARLDEAITRASLQRALAGEIVDAVSQGELWHPGRDDKLLGRVLEYLHGHAGQPIFQEDLCRDLSTSTRALRRLFPEAFGTTPARYLRFRRLHLARRALLDRRFPSVTATAVNLGFFDLGRFASSYRHLFGELPSQSLGRVSAGARLGA